MALILSEQAARRKPQIEPCGNGGQVIPFELICPAVAIAATDIVELGTIPGGFFPVSAVMAVEASGPSTLGNAGYLTESKGDLVGTIVAMAATQTVCAVAGMAAGNGADRAFGIKGLVSTTGMAGKKVVVLVTLAAF